MKVKEEELLKINGGGVNASLINSLARAGQFLYDLGRALGTAIRMGGKKKVC